MRTGLFALPKATRRRVAYWVAPSLSVLALVFLVGVATLIVLWADVPRVTQANPQSLTSVKWDHTVSVLERVMHVLLLVIWPLFVAETLFSWLCRPWTATYRRYQLMAGAYVLFPGLRLCPKMPELNGRIWLLGLGWRRVDKQLRHDVERRFSVPMIAFALLVLPILLAEQFMKEQVANSELLRATLHLGTGVIWLAFTSEFVIKCSISRNKLRYCKENWIDLLIIVLPLVAFLRSIRMLRFARLFGISYLVHLGRAYRLRGLLLKTMRAITILELADRLFRGSPARQLHRLRDREQILHEELVSLRARIRALEIECDGDDASENSECI